jgi:hypothetical protein
VSPMCSRADISLTIHPRRIKSRLAAEGWVDELRVLEEDLAVLYGSRFKHHELFARGGQLKDWGEEIRVSSE